MNEPSKPSIEDRLETLERAVESIHRSLRMLGVPSDQQQRTATRAPHTARSTPEASAAAGRSAGLELSRRPPGLFASLVDRGPEFWISRVGIVLLLVGVAYLFKYAVDQGWLTPSIRVAFGLALGAVLAVIGFRVHTAKRWFAHVMLGGASATWYITGFAAFQLLNLVSFPVAFGFMVLVTLFTFWVGLQQDEPALALLAAFGGLATPFLLYTDSGSVQGLMTYTTVVLLGTSGIYLHKGWKSLLWFTAVDAWLVVALALEGTSTSADRSALQTGVLAIWLLFWLVPVGRELLSARSPARWAPATWQLLRRKATQWPWLQHDVAWLIVLSTVTAYFASLAVWNADIDDAVWGAIGLAGSAVYVLVSRAVARSSGGSSLTSAHTVTAAVLAAAGVVFLFETDVVIVIWAIEAGILHAVAVRDTRAVGRPVPSLTGAAYLLSAIVALWLLQRLLEGRPPETVILNARALADAAVVTVTLATVRWVRPDVRVWFWLVAHVAILAWLARELRPLPTGSGMVTASWGVYALGLLLFMKRARKVALATLFLAVGKLVLFDMSQVEPIWRVLLFLGFGAAFLGISYFFTDLLGAPKNQSDSDTP